MFNRVQRATIIDSNRISYTCQHQIFRYFIPHGTGVPIRAAINIVQQQDQEYNREQQKQEYCSQEMHRYCNVKGTGNTRQRYRELFAKAVPLQYCRKPGVKQQAKQES